MKLKAGLATKFFPPRLRELVIKRSIEQHIHRTREEALTTPLPGAFVFSRTPEKHEFWRNICDGKEFNWNESLNLTIWPYYY